MGDQKFHDANTESPENPPAFPRDHRHLGHNGMDLRDWFAGQALAGLTGNSEMCRLARGMADADVDRGISREAYRFADAMLAARVAK